MKNGSNLLKGIAWVVTLWVVSNSYLMPVLYSSGFWFPTWGTFFPKAVGGGQANLIFDNFVWHATYGFLLGLFFSPVLRKGASMVETSSRGSVSQWGQIILGWIVIIIGGAVSTSVAGDASWGVIVGIIGLIIATGPPFRNWRIKT